MCYKLNIVRAPKCGRRKCVSHVFRVFLLAYLFLFHHTPLFVAICYQYIRHKLMFEAAETPKPMRHHLESHFSAKCALLNRLIERGLQELIDSLQDALTLPASLNISLIGLSSHILPQFIHILGGTLIPTAISITTTRPRRCRGDSHTSCVRR